MWLAEGDQLLLKLCSVFHTHVMELNQQQHLKEILRRIQWKIIGGLKADAEKLQNLWLQMGSLHQSLRAHQAMLAAISQAEAEKL